MVYPGYLAIGVEDPLGSPPTTRDEIVNTSRAMAYAEASGALGWLMDCGVCDVIEPVIAGAGYSTVAADPAPWYDATNIDAAGFYGVVGLDVVGADGSTRSANVLRSVGGGGVVGPTFQEPRTIVVRALAIAETEPSLSYGLRWLSSSFLTTAEPCGTAPVTFFESCPPEDCVTDDRPVGPCWPTTYGQFAAGPPFCTPDWWPDTYAQVVAGPPYLHTATEGDWCAWVRVYYELRSWLPPWGCCEELFVVGRMREFRDARVTAGPEVLGHPVMSSGAMAEIEFTIVAGKPTAEPPTYLG